MVVLNEVDGPAHRFFKNLLIEALVEETAFIAKYFWFEKDYIRDGEWGGSHCYSVSNVQPGPR